MVDIPQTPETPKHSSRSMVNFLTEQRTRILLAATGAAALMQVFSGDASADSGRQVVCRANNPFGGTSEFRLSPKDAKEQGVKPNSGNKPSEFRQYTCFVEKNSKK